MVECVRARLRLVPAQDGGRTRPIATGYRPNWGFGERDGDVPQFWMGQVYLTDREWLQPGDEADVRVCVVGERWQRARVGDVIDVCEGPRLVGRATLIAIEGEDVPSAR